MFLGDQSHDLILLLGSQAEFVQEINQFVNPGWHDPGMSKVLIEAIVEMSFDPIHLLRCQHVSRVGHKLRPDSSSATDGIAKPNSSVHESAPVRDIGVNLLTQSPCGIHDILDGRDDPAAPIESDLYKLDFLLPRQP
jgi:hypothetical protein